MYVRCIIVIFNVLATTYYLFFFFFFSFFFFFLFCTKILTRNGSEAMFLHLCICIKNCDYCQEENMIKQVLDDQRDSYDVFFWK